MLLRSTRAAGPTLNEKSRPSKARLDQVLVDQGLAPSRTKAAALVMAGVVRVGDRRLDKPGQIVDTTAVLTVTQTPLYVSRGGDKLASVAGELALDFKNLLVLDVGSSTGGFTDYALAHGAREVVAVDVGTAQLDWRLREHPRVQLHERTDIRDLPPLDPPVDLALVDVSFVSVVKIIDAVIRQVKIGGRVIVMVKPQFEAGKAVADRYHGVISDEAVRQEILATTHVQLSRVGQILAEADSKVLGPKGNHERFMVLVPKR